MHCTTFEKLTSSSMTLKSQGLPTTLFLSPKQASHFTQTHYHQTPRDVTQNSKYSIFQNYLNPLCQHLPNSHNFSCQSLLYPKCFMSWSLWKFLPKTVSSQRMAWCQEFITSAKRSLVLVVPWKVALCGFHSLAILYHIMTSCLWRRDIFHSDHVWEEIKLVNALVEVYS